MTLPTSLFPISGLDCYLRYAATEQLEKELERRKNEHKMYLYPPKNETKSWYITNRDGYVADAALIINQPLKITALCTREPGTAGVGTVERIEFELLPCQPEKK